MRIECFFNLAIVLKLTAAENRAPDLTHASPSLYCKVSNITPGGYLKISGRKWGAIQGGGVILEQGLYSKLFHHRREKSDFFLRVYFYRFFAPGNIGNIVCRRKNMAISEKSPSQRKTCFSFLGQNSEKWLHFVYSRIF